MFECKKRIMKKETTVVIDFKEPKGFIKKVKKPKYVFLHSIISRFNIGGFKIKIASSWFSEDYIVLKYTTNGIFWKKVKEYEYDILDKWCYMTTKTSSFDNAKYLLEKFNTLEKVKQYEDEQRGRVRKHNVEISAKNKKHKDKRQEIYKQYS
jgi:hypothetical protein